MRGPIASNNSNPSRSLRWITSPRRPAKSQRCGGFSGCRPTSPTCRLTSIRKPGKTTAGVRLRQVAPDPLIWQGVTSISPPKPLTHPGVHCQTFGRGQRGHFRLYVPDAAGWDDQARRGEKHAFPALGERRNAGVWHPRRHSDRFLEARGSPTCRTPTTNSWAQLTSPARMPPAPSPTGMRSLRRWSSQKIVIRQFDHRLRDRVIWEVPMRLTQRKYRCDDDYWAVRQFLREVFLLNGRREFSWPLYRWDTGVGTSTQTSSGSVWKPRCSCGNRRGSLAAVLHPDGPGEAFLEVHPAFSRPSWRRRCCQWRRRSSPRRRLTAASAW